RQLEIAGADDANPRAAKVLAARVSARNREMRLMVMVSPDHSPPRPRIREFTYFARHDRQLARRVTATASSTREAMPSLVKTCLRCVSTVRRDTYSRSPTCGLLRPV